MLLYRKCEEQERKKLTDIEVYTNDLGFHKHVYYKGKNARLRTRICHILTLQPWVFKTI